MQDISTIKNEEALKGLDTLIATLDPAESFALKTVKECPGITTKQLWNAVYRNAARIYEYQISDMMATLRPRLKKLGLTVRAERGPHGFHWFIRHLKAPV